MQLLQFRSRIEDDPLSAKLYSGVRPGYWRPKDFWEIPIWAAQMEALMWPDCHFRILDPRSVPCKLGQTEKERPICMSVLDCNKHLVKSLVRFNPQIMFLLGGYIDPNYFMDDDNVCWFNSMEEFATTHMKSYDGALDYGAFVGKHCIPRLTLSTGCLHVCSFCSVPKKLEERSPAYIMRDIDAMADLRFRLVYINDKTFGQAKNYPLLATANELLKRQDDNFLGFIIQTTPLRAAKPGFAKFLAEAGVKYVELGIESYNDPILRAMHKPSSEKKCDEAALALRMEGISLVPNIMVGLPGETPATYARTLKWLQDNQEECSHINLYNLAIYHGTPLATQLVPQWKEDQDENVIQKSWSGERYHEEAYWGFVGCGLQMLSH